MCDLMNNKARTAIFIGLMAIVIVLYDFITYFKNGAESTISAVINEWAFDSHPLLVFLLGVIAGGLVIHFLEWRPVNCNHEDK